MGITKYCVIYYLFVLGAYGQHSSQLLVSSDTNTFQVNAHADTNTLFGQPMSNKFRPRYADWTTTRGPGLIFKSPDEIPDSKEESDAAITRSSSSVRRRPLNSNVNSASESLYPTSVPAIPAPGVDYYKSPETGSKKVDDDSSPENGVDGYPLPKVVPPVSVDSYRPPGVTPNGYYPELPGPAPDNYPTFPTLAPPGIDTYAAPTVASPKPPTLATPGIDSYAAPSLRTPGYPASPPPTIATPGIDSYRPPTVVTPVPPTLATPGVDIYRPPPVETLPPLVTFPPATTTEEFVRGTTGTFLPNTTTTQPATTTTPPAPETTTHAPHNGVKGNPHLFCLNDSIIFTSVTWFPFTGRIFARGQENNPLCLKIYTTETKVVNVTFPYEICGTAVPQPKETTQTFYSIEIVLQFHETILNEHTVQTFFAQCMSQQVVYEKEKLSLRIEEALEELNITPIHIEKRAEMPQCTMRIVPEPEGEPHSYGASGADAVQGAFIGQQLKVEWMLQPPSDAFGFLVKNCTVLDEISGKTYQVLDDKGCSSDINIFGHPHYDIYHDLAIVHWHAFKVPDNTHLSINCACQVCSDIVDDTGTKGCDLLPTPPFCPKVEKIPFQSPSNLFLDFQRDFVASNLIDQLNVQAEVQVFDKNQPIPEEALAEIEDAERRRVDAGIVTKSSVKRGSVCISKTLFYLVMIAAGLAFLFFAGLCVTLCCIRRRIKLSNSSRQSENNQSSTPLSVMGSSLTTNKSHQEETNMDKFVFD